MSKNKKDDIGSVVNISEKIEAIKPLYLTPNENISREVLIPGYQEAESADCMVGFFSSSSLSLVAPGLATYLHRTDKPLRLIISPHLSDWDIQAMEGGIFGEEEIINGFFDSIFTSEEQLVNFTLRSLSFLIKENRVEIKIALLKDALFHLKVWLFHLDIGTFAVHGSTNFTLSGISRNKEQISISKSWVDNTQSYTTTILEDQFDSLWTNNEMDCKVIALPMAISDKLVKKYSNGERPTENELAALYQKAESGNQPDPNRQEFIIPKGLVYDSGPYQHQGKAVDAWKANKYRGILSMATGSGKTITAMIGSFKLWKELGSLVVVITAPYIPLLNQWEEEVKLFGLDPTNLSGVSAAQKAKTIARIRRRLDTQQSSIEVIIISQKSLNGEDFVKELSKITTKSLLIGDEVHNLGSSGFQVSAPTFYDYRMGLSATPIRQYDSEGTDFLLDYFGRIVFEYSLEEAINSCLVPYDYHIHPVMLTEDEMDRWSEITHQIKSNNWRLVDNEPDAVLQSLFRKRRLILESAENKILTLKNLLSKQVKSDLKHTLIYCTDKNPGQMLEVNSILNESKITFRKITDEESSDVKLTKAIIRDFKEGDIQVLTAKRVLDEGVNIPQISRAYILASTTVERQWVQRRGRLLRRSPDTGKTKSVIHDFVVLPPETADDEGLALIRSELIRLTEFGEIALNAGAPDGPLRIIHELRQKVFY